jgi:hypothetical protein
MEDRYDISVDIGDGKDWWYVHGLTTHDKVYELNKQMCDIGKAILTKKKNDMEEKKTKKMTKAEAFEWLKGKKVNAKDKDRVVQMKMFDCGIKWRCGKSEYFNFGSLLFIDNEGFLSHCGNDKEYWKRHAYKEISADDIISIEIVKDKNGEEAALDLISTVGARLSKVLRDMEGHKHVVITEDDVILYEEGMCLFHSEPF